MDLWYSQKNANFVSLSLTKIRKNEQKFKNNRIRKHDTNFKDLPSPSVWTS